MTLRLVVSLLLAVSAVRGDEMAFVDVSSDDKINIRGLDGTVHALVGARNLFDAEPMAAHEWANPKTVAGTLDAEVVAWSHRDATTAGARLLSLHDELAPLYAVLPKNEHGRLDAGTVRYGLHRYFTKRYGWSMKGLEPAGAAWQQSIQVDEDVRQMSKFIVPSYLQDLAAQRVGDGKGLDLAWFTIVAATLKHMAHAELTEYLYSVYRTLGYSIPGVRSVDEAEDIVAGFMALYAFGTDLEVSAGEDLRGAREFLDAHHEGWRQLRRLSHEALRAAAAAPAGASATAALDFDGVRAFVEDLIGKRYSDFQNQDCARAAERLADSPGARGTGRAFLQDLVPINASGRRALFAEDQQELARLGVLEDHGPDGGAPALVVPNYLLSPALCLTTAGPHAVCCRNSCDEMLERAEAAAGGPEATPGSIAAALGVDGAGLDALAGVHGTVALHGRGLAEWLHGRFPLECPTPRGDRNGTSPKTADEWMAAPGRDTDATDAMIAELSQVLVRYTTLGSTSQDRQAQEGVAPHTSEADERAVETLRRPLVAVPGAPHALGWPFLRSLLRLAAVASMVALALARGRAALGSAVAAVSGRAAGSEKVQKAAAAGGIV